ncbi:unnamed protein product [Effrenium voratum]|nr:unnamed protein product [Effrenium voratum]
MIVSNVPKKTRLCTFHERGKCSKGRLCTFAHSVEELQGTPAAQPLGSHGRSVQVCHHFQTQRRCKYGSECKFSHVRGSNDSDSATRGPEIQRRPLKTQLCRHYQQGSCRHGSDCTYAHDEHELQAPNPGSALLRASGNVQRESLESWLRLVVAEPNPDLQEAALSKGAAQLAGGLHALSLLSLENVVSILRSAQGSLRRDRLESTLRSLGGALMPELLQKYALEVPTGKKLDELLEALSIVVEVERRFGALLDLPSVRDGIEQIVATRGTEDSPGLWAQLKAAQSGASPLRKVVRRQVAEVELQDVDVQELPCIDELLQLPSNLPVNRGTWAEGDEERHRITHYRLCREELLAPLREAVASYLASNGVKHQGMQRVLDQTGGESTFFAYPSCHAVGFSTGNHLIFGSLVLLFETNSDGHPIASSSIYATIEEFDLDNVLRHRSVGLGMLDEENWRKFNVTQKYAMVESPGYYHAVRPVLRKFRSPIDATPLWQDILTGKAKAVDYFQGARVDLSCLYKRELPKQSHWACCDPQHEWPDPHDIELDASQQKAIRHILASSVSLVQEPPGTGKSYIGVKAVQLARQALEQHEYREPIALICLTNHALDQFLEDLLDIFPRNGDLIRFGGRSKSEDPRLAGCQVNKFLRSSREDFEERTALESQLENVAGNLNKEVRLLADQRCQLGLLLAGMPTEKLHTLLGEVGADLMEAGLYMAPHSRRRVQQANPKGFVLEILSAWLEGRPLEQVRQDASWRLPSVSKPKTTETFNRFSTLAADEGELPSQVQVLTMIDREVGALPMIACETSHQVMLDFEDSDSNSDADLEGFEGLDMDEINTILDDRMDSQVSRPRAQQRARSQLTGPQLDAKIQDRRTAFQRAEGWEREVQAG